METSAVTTARGAHADLGGRVGPVVAGVALLAMLGMLVWVSSVPDAVVGNVADAPFTLDARLLVAPQDGPCARLVDGRGATTELCTDIEDASLAYFAEDGLVAIGTWEELALVDPATGETVGTTTEEELLSFQAPEPADREPGTEGEVAVEEPVRDGPRMSHDGLEPGEWVYTTGGEVWLGRDDGEDELLLDLGGPPGYDVWGAALSPDRELVVVHDRSRVLVAEVGADEAWLWVEVDEGRFELYRGIDWG